MKKQLLTVAAYVALQFGLSGINTAQAQYTFTMANQTWTGFSFTQMPAGLTGTLTSVSVNVTLNASVGYTYADDICIYVAGNPLALGGFFQAGGFSNLNAAERQYWPNGASDAPGTTCIGTLTLNTPIVFTGAPSDPVIWIGNGYGASGTSGTFTGSATLNGISLGATCTAPTLSATTVAALCAGNANGSIDLTTTGGSPTPLIYAWSNGGSTEDLTGLTAGTYTVTVTTQTGGCSATGSYTVADGAANVTYYADADGDTYGNAAVSQTSCTGAPVGYVADNTDCDDNNSSASPVGLEICGNGIDEDCSGSDCTIPGCIDANACNFNASATTDDGSCVYPTLNYFVDFDSDGYGLNDMWSMPNTFCTDPGLGWSLNNLDCDDSNGLIFPGATELCNGLDDDCSGIADDGLTFNEYFADADGDSFGTPALNYVVTPITYQLLTPQVLSSNVTLDLAGRIMSYTGISINGATNTEVVAAGSTVSLAYNLAVTWGPNLYCPGCMTQSYIGIGGSTTTLQCENGIYDGYTNSYNSGTFIAPTTPGTYYLVQNGSLDYLCQPQTYDNTSANAIAILQVEGTLPAAANPGPNCDDCTSQIPIGFSFPFYGNTYSDLAISSNGFVSFDLTVDDGCCFGNVVPGADAVNNMIALGWYDLVPDNGQVTYFNLTNPNRLVIQYSNAPEFFNSGSLSGQIVMFESGLIQLIYSNLTTVTHEATAGVENASGTVGVTISGLNAQIGSLSNVAYEFVYMPSTLNSGISSCTPLVGYALNNTDCLDNNPAINPGAAEVCNGIDDNCDTQIDEGLQNTYYADADGDSYGDAGTSIQACTSPVGYVADNTDCDDTNSSVNPVGVDICGNGIDEDCSGSDCTIPGCIDANACNFNASATTDDGSCVYPTLNYFVDFDSDGYGLNDMWSMPNTFCTDPGLGWSLNNLDCDDSNGLIFPGATELCNGLDDDCSGIADDGLTFNEYFADADGDSFGTPALNYVVTPITYQLLTPQVLSSNVTLDLAGRIMSYTGISINGATNTEVVAAGSTVSLAYNLAVTWGPNLYCPGCMTQSYIGIGGSTTTLQCENGIYDGYTNSYNSGTFIAPTTPGTYYLVQNGSLDYLCQPQTYDNTSANAIAILQVEGTLPAAANPGPNCDDCTSQIPIGFSFPFYGNTYSDLAISSNGFVSFDLTVDDGCCFGNVVPGADAVNNMIALGWYDLVPDNGQVTYFNLTNPNRLVIQYSNAPEFFNSGSLSGQIVMFESGLIQLIYSNLTTVTHEATAGVENASGTVGVTLSGLNAQIGSLSNVAYEFVYMPSTLNSGISSCTPLVGYALNNTDCLDNNPAINPGATEVCNGIDDNCDTQIDEGLTFTDYYADLDLDGYGAGTATNACAQPVGYVTTNTDCNNNNAAVNPGATELCTTSVDDNCNGLINEGCSTAGENPTNATSMTTSIWPNCNAINGTLVNASASGSAQTICLTGEDKWHQFVATSEGVSIVVNSTSADILIELQTSAGVLVAEENAVSGLGGEILNHYGLTAGQVYKIGVRNYNSALGTGTYSICAKMLKRGGCDYGPGPYTLCQYFKATWAGATGTSYTYTFTGISGPASGNVYTRTQNSDICVLSSVLPTLPYGSTYNVLITNTYTLNNGAGVAETISVPGLAPCSMSTATQPVTALRVSNQCAAGPRFRGAVVASLPWVCGSTNWRWEFTELDAQSQPVGLPITVNRGAASNYINLGSVLQLQYGKTYSVRTAPILPYTGTDYQWGAPVCMSIVGTAGMIADGQDASESTSKVEIANEVNMSLYPNPTHGTDVNINLSGVTSENVQIRVVDAMGRQVWSNRYSVDGILNTNITFEQPLANGLYFVEAIYNGELQTQRMMVQR
jgi:hypothetical protein